MHTIDRGLKENFYRWEGRLNRKRYLKRMLALWIPGSILCFAVLITVVLIVLGGNINRPHLSMSELMLLENTLGGTVLLTLLPFLISSYMLMMRRLHDLDLSGYFSLMNFVPFVNIGLTFYLFFAAGTQGANAYGSDPLAREDAPGEEIAAAGIIGEGAAAEPGDISVHAEEISAAPKGLSLPPIFSRTGRLSRRDYALSIGVLFGSTSVITLIGSTFLMPFVYLFVNVFFRDTTVFFWGFLILGVLILLSLIYAALPLLSIPATIRRLHDFGYNGFFALPLVLVSLFTGGCSLFFLTILLSAFTAATGVPILGPPNEGFALFFSIFAVGFTLLIFPVGAILVFYSSWVFLKKGDAYPNDYGDVPAEQPLSSIRTEFFSTEGTLGRRTFILSSLFLLFVTGIAVPTVVQLVIYPVTALLLAANVLPAGADYFILLLSSALYPLTLLPLVIRRLRTLGLSAYEAVCPFAVVIPTILLSVPLAGAFGSLERMDDGGLDGAILAPLFDVMGGHELAYIVFTCVCSIISILGIVRLLAKDAGAEGNA